MASVACGVAFAQAPGEPIERDERVTPSPIATTTAATSPTSRPARGPATRLAPSTRPRSKPTTRAVKFDLKPARVTLRLKDKPADQVFEALSKQTGAVFELSDDLWRDATPRVPAIEIVDKPFWPALRQVFLATGTDLTSPPPLPIALGGRASREQGIIPIGPQRGAGGVLPGIEAGSILIQPQSVSRTVRIDFAEPQELTRASVLFLRLLVEPRLNVVPLSPPVRLDAATDQKGRPIVSAPMRPPQVMPSLNNASLPQYFETPGIWRVPLALTLPAPDTLRIAKLKAFAEFVAMTGGMEIEIPDVLNVGGTEFRLDNGVRLLIHEATARGGRQIMIRFVAWNEGHNDPAKWEQLRRGFFTWGNRARLMMADGQGVAANMLATTATADANVVDADFAFTIPPGVTPQGKYKLIWTAPTSAELMSVPFELTDVPLQ
jgi:hypothetical protein